MDETKALFTADELKQIPELNLKSYCSLVEHLAKEIEEQTGISYLIPIIQSAHESRNGNSELARKHCNLFGITATENWTKAGNQVADMPTWEVIGSKKVELHREFRRYPNWNDSFHDWGKLISTLSIYKPAYLLLKDKSTVRQGIREMAGIYATDPNYQQKLIALFDMVSPLTK